MDPSVTAQPANPLHEGITYIIERKDRGWTSRIAEESLQTLRTSLPKQVDNTFKDAMDVCCDWFYPEVTAEKRPWNQPNSIGELLERAKVGWPLEWYWKILLTSLHEWLQDKTCPNLRIRLAQVRRWVVLTVYDQPGGNQDNKPRAVMREPIFGASDRLADWEQYALYLLHSKQIVQEWKAVNRKAKIRGESAVERAYILGRHDLEYELSYEAVEIRRRGDDEQIIVKIRGRIDLTPYKKTTKRQTEEGAWDKNGVWIPSDKSAPAPYDLIDLPTFANKSVKDQSRSNNNQHTRANPEEIRLLVASDHYCKALALLSDVWNDPTIRTVHLNAPPGSGKEALSRTVYGCRRFKEGTMEIVALSPYNASYNDLVLFGKPAPADLEKFGKPLAEKIGDGENSHRDAAEGDDIDTGFEPGLVEQANRGVLVIDEIDKVEEQTRIALLRLLENSTFHVPGTLIPCTVKGREPLYVFLTSKSLTEVYECPPPDFWTRIPFTIEMQHPFDLYDTTEKQRVLQQYLTLFWMRHIKDFFEELAAKMGLPAISVENPIPRNQKPRRSKAIENYYVDVRDFFESESFTNFVASTLAKEITATYTTISVRNVRSIVQRCVFKFVDEIIYSRPFRELPTHDIKEKRKKIRSDLDKIIHNKTYEDIYKKAKAELRMTLTAIAKSALERRVDYPG